MNVREQIISFLLQTIDQKEAHIASLQAELAEKAKESEAKKPEAGSDKVTSIKK